jgi:WD40 repeat protein
MVTYPARTGPLSVSHMAVSFAPNGVRAVHACLESQIVSASDPTTGKIEKRRDPFIRDLVLTPDLMAVRNDHPDFGVAIDMNVNRVMDISEEFGWVMGENIPDGRCYLHLYPNPHIGDGTDRMGAYVGPDNYGFKPAVTCIWIAKKRSGGVRDSTGAAVVIGNSRGYVRIFSVDVGKKSNSPTQIRACCVSPGVPIVQVKVDEDFLPRRLRQARPWITVINALGEIYYLRNKPTTSSDDGWRMISQTARISTPVYSEVFPELAKDLSPEQVGEKCQKRTELLLKMEYSKIKELWEGFRMDWFIEVDWAGGNIVTGRTGSENYWHGNLVHTADVSLKRYHLRKVKNDDAKKFVRGISHASSETPTKESIFGGGDEDVASQESTSATPIAENPDEELAPIRDDEWLSTELRMNDRSFTRITSYSLDNSQLSRLAASEDATFHEGSPGGHGRLFAVGTNSGSIFVFNIRPSSAEPLELPIRTIHTDSPRISTLAVSSLVVVHGGDDGLVQAWDPLGSTRSPVRTLHSRFSARARRRIEQNLGAVTTDNQFAARCLALDPEPTRLRGAVALGTFVRYWSFSAVDTISGGGKKKHKKVGGGSKVGGTPHRNKGAIREVIQSDELALRRERGLKQKEAEELEKRYGIATGMDALNEEEMLAYARMISQEAFEAESSTRNSEGAGSVTDSSSSNNNTVTPDGFTVQNSEDADLELALRLSLQEVEVSEMEPAEEGADWEGMMMMEPGPSNYSFEHWSVSPSKPVSSTAFGPCTSSASSSPTKSRKARKGGWEKVSLEALNDWPPAQDTAAGVDEDLELAIRLSLQEQELGKGKGKEVVF